ncbi:WD40 repeat-like protein [Coprinellus micaceus]|uniref:WD40 repeat-like protein n=1 Tax=Coprinellus micaceus TaxID=71717 RepID=A0A4Y7T6K4_COPMI|nr:WD40 repeat-like protein [Coprinellus micaceus]
MSDPPQTDSPSAPKKDWLNRSKAWFDRKTDRVKNALKIGAPTTRTPSRAAFAASTTDIVLGQSASNQQDTLLRPSPTHLRPVQSFQDLTAYDATHESNVQIVPAPELDPVFDDPDATPAPADVSEIQSPGEAPSDGSGLQTATKPDSASPPLDSEETIPGLIDDPSPSPSGVKNVLKRSWDFTQTLLMKLPDVVDENPVKVALGLVKLVSEIKEAVGDNMDKTDQHIASAIGQLAILKDEQVAKWRSDGPEVPRLDEFTRTLEGELGKLRRLKSEHVLEKIASHEDEKSAIAAIFERINEGRIQFELYTNLRVFKAAVEVERAVMRSLPSELQPSHMADHRYYIEGKERETLRREACTPGTRTGTLDRIVNWAKSLSSEQTFWLFGPAGTGKTTVAYTIARFFEATGEADGAITLGGNFLCSRQFDDTRSVKRIIRTLAYQLARKCEGFANALNQLKNFDAVHHGVEAQIRDFLVTPWKEHLRASGGNVSEHYLFLIDAVDELEDNGGPVFLRGLIEAVNASHLPGIKFFVTSRSNPDIVALVDSFERKQLIRLQDVEEEEVRMDIGTYLDANLPDFRGSLEMVQIKDYADTLFICAATIVRALTLGDLEVEDQKRILQKFISAKLKNATNFLDGLYEGILSEAFGSLDEEIFSEKLCILHTFLCTAERTSMSVVSHLLASQEGSTSFTPKAVDRVLIRLHAVLYLDDRNIVLSYHKSFTDYLFDKGRSGRFACDQSYRHRLLAQQCFSVMKTGLKFNIANIPSSFLLDSENSNLDHAIEQSISPGLSYTSRSWFKHLSVTPCAPSDPFLPTLADFLQLPVLFWIETMNLLGCRGQCDPDLKHASTWVGSLAEAASFALYFSGSPASASTPHLYLSTLSTWTQEHTFPHTWRHHFPKIPQFRTLGSESSSALMQISIPKTGDGLAMSADGTQIVCGFQDNSVRIYDSSTGDEVKVLHGHTDVVLSVAISSDMDHIVSGSRDHSIRIWEASTGKELMALRGHTEMILSVAISADKTWIVSGSADTSVRIWSMVTGEQLKVLNGHTYAVLSVAITLDMTRIVSGSSDRSIQIWDVSTGEELKILEGHQAAVWSVAVSADGVHIVSGSKDKSVRVWNAATGQQLKILEGHTDSVCSVAIFPDRLHIASASDDQTVCIWDLSTGNILKVLKGHTSWVHSVAISGDGMRIASGSGDNTVWVWNVPGLKELGTQEEGHTSHAIGSPSAPDGMSIVSGLYDTFTSALGPDALASKKMEAFEARKRAIYLVAVSHDGRHIISCGEDTSIRIWDASTGKQLKVLEGHSDIVMSVATCTDGTRIVSGSQDGSVRVWDGLTGQGLRVLQGHTDKVNSVAMSVDAACIVSGSADKSIRIWDGSTGEELRILQGHKARVWAVAISANKTRIVSGSDDKSVRIWDVSTGDELMVLDHHTGCVFSLAISADMTHIVSGVTDHSIRIWDGITGEELRVLKGHTGDVNSVAISVDRKHIISGSDDKSIRVWDLGIGKEVSVLEGHIAQVFSVAIFPNGKHIVSGSVDGSVRVWAINPAPETSNKADWKLHGGWVLSEDGDNRLMFVPPHLGLSSPNLVRVFPPPEYPPPTVDFEQAALGPDWHKCYDSKCPPFTHSPPM